MMGSVRKENSLGLGCWIKAIAQSNVTVFSPVFNTTGFVVVVVVVNLLISRSVIASTIADNGSEERIDSYFPEAKMNPPSTLFVHAFFLE